MSKQPPQQSEPQQKKAPVSSSTTLTFSASRMPGQSATNEALKQISMTVQSYSSNFADIKTTMTDLKSLFDQIKTVIASFTTKFQEFEIS